MDKEQTVHGSGTVNNMLYVHILRARDTSPFLKEGLVPWARTWQFAR